VAAIRKLVSGGQTGVDRAALDVAIELGLPYGGWVPKGGRAEDMPSAPGLLALYPLLRENTSREWTPRTRANVRDSTATLIVLDGKRIGPGTKLTIAITSELAKPTLQVVPGDNRSRALMEKFLEAFPEDIALNVAGARESGSPGIYAATVAMLRGFSDLMVL
jgi:hypothetical protein